MKARKILVLLAVLTLAAFIPSFAFGAELELESKSAILVDAQSGQILYEKEPNIELAPASVTKLMTLVVAIEALEQGKVKLTDKVSASELAASMGGSQIWLEPGEELTFEEMLISIAVGSANDACVAVAEHLCGSHEAFVEAMNQKAKELGLKNTHFANAYGLPAEGHYTSAYDMAQIGRYALKYPKLLELTSMKHYDKLRGGTPKLDNTNKLLWWYKGVDGFKTGWTSEAKYCLASTAERDGLRLVAVTLGAEKPRGNFRDSIKLYNYGFSNFGFKQFYDKGAVVGQVKVGKGKEDVVNVVTTGKVGALIAKGKEKEQKFEVKVLLPQIKEAPVKKGEQLGEIVVLQGGKEIVKSPLVAGSDVARATLWEQINKVLFATVQLIK